MISFYFLGPLLPDICDVANIPNIQRFNLTIALSGEHTIIVTSLEVFQQRRRNSHFNSLLDQNQRNHNNKLGKREMLHGAKVNSKSRRINVSRADANEQVAFNTFSVYI